RRHDLLVVLESEVPGRDGSPAGAADGLQHLRGPGARAGVGEGGTTAVPDAPAGPGGGRPAGAAGRRVIEARDLTKRFGRRTAIDGVSLRVARGEVVGFLGPNGAGKTTTLRVLAGVFPPTSGQALIGGLELANAPLAARRLIGYAPEHPALHGDATVRDELGYVAALRDVPAGDTRRAAVASALALTGLESFADRRIGTL